MTDMKKAKSLEQTIDRAFRLTVAMDDEILAAAQDEGRTWSSEVRRLIRIGLTAQRKAKK